MSKTVSIVAAGASASLVQFGSSLIAKATNNAVAGAVAAAIGTNSVVFGSETPAGVHTTVTQGTKATNELYAGTKAVVVRAVLPGGSDDLPLREALDVLPNANIGSDAEIAKASESYKKSAKVAAQLAKASGATKVTLVLKQATKYATLNKVFTDAATEVFNASGVLVDVQPTPVVTNQLIMFPESAGVFFTNDNVATDNVELAFASLLGSSRTFFTDSGSVSGGHSQKTVAVAVADTLRAIGFASEAAKIDGAIAKAKTSADILNGL
jgi:hypothetical protein